MGIELEDAEAGMPLGAGRDGTEWSRVIAAHEDGQAAAGAGEAFVEECFDSGVDLGADLVDLRDRRGIVFLGAPLLDQGLSQRPGRGIPAPEALVDGGHPDPFFIGFTEAQVEEVDLPTGRQNGLGAVGGPTPVRRSGLKGGPEDMHLGVIGPVGEAKEPAVGTRGGVGIEFHAHILASTGLGSTPGPDDDSWRSSEWRSVAPRSDSP